MRILVSAVNPAWIYPRDVRLGHRRRRLKIRLSHLRRRCLSRAKAFEAAVPVRPFEFHVAASSEIDLRKAYAMLRLCPENDRHAFRGSAGQPTYYGDRLRRKRPDKFCKTIGRVGILVRVQWAIEPYERGGCGRETPFRLSVSILVPPLKGRVVVCENRELSPVPHPHDSSRAAHADEAPTGLAARSGCANPV